MENLFNILTGPCLYIAMAVFTIGLIGRFVLYFLGLDWKLDRVAYKAHMGQGLKGGIHSALKWLVPFATHGWRSQPLAAIGFFLLHLGVVLVPIFLLGHNVILQQRFGFSLPTLPQGIADALTILSLVGLAIMLLRRLLLPNVRILTTGQDYLLIVLVLIPLVTGFLAVQGFGNYKALLLCHIISGEVLLVLAPFTKLSHIALYFASRMQIGMDYAIKRGGRTRESGAFFPW